MKSLQSPIEEKGAAFAAPSRMSATYATELSAGRCNLERAVRPGAVS